MSVHGTDLCVGMLNQSVYTLIVGRVFYFFFNFYIQCDRDDRTASL